MTDNIRLEYTKWLGANLVERRYIYFADGSNQRPDKQTVHIKHLKPIVLNFAEYSKIPNYEQQE